MHKRLSLSAAALLTGLVAVLPVANVWSADETAADSKAADRKAAADMRKKLGKALSRGDVKEDGLYEMSKDELAMDCKRMTGSMKITINRLRDAATRQGGSSLAESAHKSVPIIMQGSTASADWRATLARERAKLVAYNRNLAARNCKTLDIDAELTRAADGPKKY